MARQFVRAICAACALLAGCHDAGFEGLATSGGGAEPGRVAANPVMVAKGEGGQGGQALDAATAGAAAQAGASSCEGTPAEPYEAGMTALAPSGMRVTLVSSTPAPGVGNHDWSFAIADAAGDPVVDASVRVTPFMPQHRHGSPLVAQVEEQGDGLYSATPVEFTMTGYWRTTIKVTTESWVDSAVFALCIE